MNCNLSVCDAIFWLCHCEAATERKFEGLVINSLVTPSLESANEIAYFCIRRFMFKSIDFDRTCLLAGQKGGDASTGL